MKIIRLLYLFILLSLFSCEFVRTQMIERSFSINEAKKNGVFIKEYYVSQKKINLNDSVSFEFEEIWMESVWKYVNQNKDIEVDSSANKGTVLFKFKNETNASIKNKGIEIFSKEVPYSGFNNIYFELNNINSAVRNSVLLKTYGNGIKKLVHPRFF